MEDHKKFSLKRFEYFYLYVDAYCAAPANANFLNFCWKFISGNNRLI